MWTEYYLVAAAFKALTFLVRLLVLVLVLVLVLPLFIMAAFVGFVDGLVRRDVRKFGAGGRESGFIYHHAKALLMPQAVLPWVIYRHYRFQYTHCRSCDRVLRYWDF